MSRLTALNYSWRNILRVYNTGLLFRWSVHGFHCRIKSIMVRQKQEPFNPFSLLGQNKYSPLSLSLLHLSWITTYLEVKIWSLFKHENLTSNKILWKRGEITPPLFHNIFNFFNFKDNITYSFVKCGCSIYVLLNSVNLTWRGKDISKHFRESLWLKKWEYTVLMQTV